MPLLQRELDGLRSAVDLWAGELRGSVPRPLDAIRAFLSDLFADIHQSMDRGGSSTGTATLPCRVAVSMRSIVYLTVQAIIERTPGDGALKAELRAMQDWLDECVDALDRKVKMEERESMLQWNASGHPPPADVRTQTPLQHGRVNAPPAQRRASDRGHSPSQSIRPTRYNATPSSPSSLRPAMSMTTRPMSPTTAPGSIPSPSPNWENPTVALGNPSRNPALRDSGSPSTQPQVQIAFRNAFAHKSPTAARPPNAFSSLRRVSASSNVSPPAQANPHRQLPPPSPPTIRPHAPAPFWPPHLEQQRPDPRRRPPAEHADGHYDSSFRQGPQRRPSGSIMPPPAPPAPSYNYGRTTPGARSYDGRSSSTGRSVDGSDNENYM